MLPRPLRPLLLALFVWPLAASGAAPVALAVTPANPVLAGDPVHITLTGLPAGAEVRLTGERLVVSSVLGGKRVLFRSEARFTTSAAGTLDLDSAVPNQGTYRGADPRGLFWSMVTTDETPDAGALPGRVRLRAFLGEQAVAEATVHFIQALEAVEVEPIPAFPGAVLARLPGAAKRPVILLLGGAEGGAKAARDAAPKLASRGFAVLGLPYYSPAAMPGAPRELPELPADFVEIPVDRLAAVYEWIRQRPDLDADRIALYGGSKGAEFALLAATRFPWVRAVVAMAPSDVVWEGWGWGVAPGTRSSFSFGGEPLPFVPYVDFAREVMGLAPDGEIHLRRPHDAGRAAHPAAAVAARIPIERYAGALLLIAGQDDQLWNAAMMAHNLAERRAAAKLATEVLIFSDAGHYLNGEGWAPTTHLNQGRQKSGGTPAGNARGQAAAWSGLLAFLERTLGLSAKGVEP